MSAPVVIRGVDELRSVRPHNSAVTLGVFDGVHRGHDAIIRDLIAVRDAGGADGCYLITFDPHPLVVTHSKARPPLLTTIAERVRLLSRYALDGIVVLEFDKELAEVEYREFVDRFLIKALGMTRLVIGYDCYFGRNREGSPERVAAEGQRRGFDVKVVSAKRTSDEVVSSTRIRNALIEGDINRANRLLGHPYLLSGTVVHGNGQGKGLGFPTANIAIENRHKLWPPRGVYAVTVELDGPALPGMMNVGEAPTMKADGRQEIEVHLLDFDGDLYGRDLWVFCHRYLRPEKRFPSAARLVEQLGRDRDDARKALESVV